MTQYQSPFDLQDEHMRMVGIISAHWEYVEFIMHRSVAAVLKQDHKNISVLTRKMSHMNRLTILKNHCKQYKNSDPDHWRKWSAILKDVREALKLRNDYIHTHWHNQADCPHPMSYQVDYNSNQFRDKLIPLTLKKLQQDADFIYLTGKALHQIIEKNKNKYLI